jgi:Putative zinc-finger
MTPIVDCEDLDAYLLGELADDEADAFASHLLSCAACRDAVDEQRWIDGLLTSPIGTELESRAPAILSAVDARRRSRRVVAACGLATAAMLLIAVGWVLQRGPGAPVPPTVIAAIDHNVAPAVFIGGDDLIVVPVESQIPGVTIARLYPAYQPEVELAFKSGAAPTSGKTNWSDNFSGG